MIATDNDSTYAELAAKRPIRQRLIRRVYPGAQSSPSRSTIVLVWPDVDHNVMACLGAFNRTNCGADATPTDRQEGSPWRIGSDAEPG